jgi:hypothetical protein
MILLFGMEIFMIEARALSPHLGVEVTGVGNLLDDAVVAQASRR